MCSISTAVSRAFHCQVHCLLSLLQFVDEQVGRLVSELKNQGLYNDTAIIITAKHGQVNAERASPGYVGQVLPFHTTTRMHHAWHAHMWCGTTVATKQCKNAVGCLPKAVVLLVCSRR